MTKTANTRMEDALALADLCWSKASGQFPEFVERYLELAEELLISKPQVTGDEFREHCRANGLYRPQGLHHNVWVSAVRFVHKLGWTTPIKKVEPVKTHNHMPSVTLWHSELFGKQTEEGESHEQRVRVL